MTMVNWERAILELIAGMIFLTTMYIVGVEYFGYFGYLAFISIFWMSILIVLTIWLRANRKAIFVIDEEE